METKNIVTILNKIANQSQDWFAISQKIKERIQSPESDLIPFFYAFQYIIVEKQNSEYYEQFGPLAPFMTFTDGRTSPPPLNTICEETLRNWEKVLLQTSNPLICSRLSDLLWLRKWKGEESYKFAQTAIDNYCSLSEGSLIDTQVPEALERALDLSCQINDKSRKTKIINKIICIWNQSLEENNHPPKMSFGLLNLLMFLPKDEIPLITKKFINGLLEVYDGNSHMTEILLSHKIKLTDDKKEKGKLIKKRVSIWIEESDKFKEKGLIRHAHLLHAMELAKIAGKSDLIDEIRVKIQETKVSTNDFKELSFEVQIPREKIDRFLKPFQETSNWKEGFDLLGSNLPPTGDYKINSEEVNQQVNESPIRFLAQNIIYDRNNLPIQRSTSLEESKEIALIQNETFKIGGFAQFIPSIFKTLLDKHGMPTNEELNDCFSSTLINEELSIIISEATLKYLNGRYKDSCFLLIPVIEIIIREMVKELGLAIYKEPSGIRPGGVYTLGYLMSQLEGRLDESWRRYIKNILIEPLSINIRNEICHGLLLDPGIEEASLLLHIVCYFRLLKIKHIPVQGGE